MCPRGFYGAPSWDSNYPANGEARRRAGEAAERGDLDGRGVAQGQLLAHHPARVADGCNQAQHHAGDRGTAAVRLEAPASAIPATRPAVTRRSHADPRPSGDIRLARTPLLSREAPATYGPAHTYTGRKRPLTDKCAKHHLDDRRRPKPLVFGSGPELHHQFGWHPPAVLHLDALRPSPLANLGAVDPAGRCPAPAPRRPRAART